MTRSRPLAIWALLQTAALTAPLALAGACEQPVDEKTVRVDIEGMVCTSCEQGIGHALERLEGVAASEVDHKQGRAEVRYDANKVTPEQIVTTINELGYTASLAN